MTGPATHIKHIFSLSFEIAKADFKLKNEGSYLGIFWYLLNPALMFALLYFIFSDRLGADIPYYTLYLLLGILLFNLFQSTTLESTRSLAQENHYLIKSINFPRISLILAIQLKNLFSHFFEMVLFCIILLFFHMGSVWIASYIPLLALFCIFIFGFSLILSSLTVFFVDLDNIWNFAVRLIWFGTPIFYAIAGQTKLFYLNICNPLYYFITAAREMIIYHTVPPVWIVWGMFGFGISFLLLGLLIFNRLQAKIAELI